MITAPIPANDLQRVSALHALQVLDTPYEERFDRFTRLASRLFQVPIALISLVDTNRQWFKSCIGLGVPETGRDISFCGHAIMQREPLVIEDTWQDVRFYDNPLVTGAPYIRFYAGHPLATPDGHNIGTLCLISDRPRSFDQADRAALKDLAILAQNELNNIELTNTLREKTEAEQALKESEERNRVLSNAAFEGIAILAKDILIEANQALSTIFGYELSELIGINMFKLIAPEQHLQVVQAIQRSYTEPYEITGLKKDGTRIDLEVRGQHLRYRNQPARVVVLRDITQRKELDRVKSEFISVVSHELRTPITSIRGALGLVIGGVTGEVPAQVKSLVEIAHKNSDRLARLINDILDIEKIEAGKMVFNMAPVDVAFLVEQTIGDNRPYAGQLGVTLQLNEPVPQVKIYGDSDRLVQALTNLLSNSAKFSPTGECVCVHIEANEETVRVNITDKGPGIPAEFRGRIFQKFAQADSSDQRKKGGTGLGLSITKAIIEAHGGQLGFETGEGKGTTFFFVLPRLPE